MPPSDAHEPITHALLHSTLIRHFLEYGCAPSVDNLAVLLRRSRDVVVSALRALEEYHGVVLHPGSGEVWVVHPFSGSPTSFWVEGARGRWWGNCAWCSLGIVALAGGDATITTVLGAESRQVTITVRDGAVAPTDLVVHFPIPMVRAWDNVTYTCSNMLVFRGEADVDDWCHRHRMPRGDVQPLSNVWEFARVWYGRHADADWAKWTTAEARGIFERFNLRGPIWELPSTADRF